MNFSTHKNQIADLVELALGKKKKDLIARFKIILGQCDRLFESDRFAFWLKQLGSIPEAEVPITKFGISEASRSITYLRSSDRNHFQSCISANSFSPIQMMTTFVRFKQNITITFIYLLPKCLKRVKWEIQI